jgi:hypothetical protein
VNLQSTERVPTASWQCKTDLYTCIFVLQVICKISSNQWYKGQDDYSIDLFTLSLVSYATQITLRLASNRAGGMTGRKNRETLERDESVICDLTILPRNGSARPGDGALLLPLYERRVSFQSSPVM